MSKFALDVEWDWTYSFIPSRHSTVTLLEFEELYVTNQIQREFENNAQSLASSPQPTASLAMSRKSSKMGLTFSRERKRLFPDSKHLFRLNPMIFEVEEPLNPNSSVSHTPRRYEMTHELRAGFLEDSGFRFANRSVT